MRARLLRVIMAVVLVFGAVALTACGQSTSSPTAAPANCNNPYHFKDPNASIGISYSFLGNSWRKTMQNDVTKVVNTALRCKEIGHVYYTYAGTSESQQISQIDDLILKHVKVIMVDAASSTALNGVIAKANAAGIRVVNFDTPVTSNKAVVLNWNYLQLGKSFGKYMASRLHGRGNVIFVRGVPGNTIDTGQYNGWRAVLKHYPHIHVLGSVYGQWDEATAESQVSGILSGLPTINAVFVDGGGYGVISAFQAAHRPIPIIVGGNRGAFLHWWWAHRNTYQTYSISTYPEVGALAFYVSQFIIAGHKVPNGTLPLAFLKITKQTLPKYHNIPTASVADATYNVTWVYKHLITH